MTRIRKILGLLPFFMAYFICDKTLVNFALTMVAGLIFWIPYWLAWWLSDEFNIFNSASAYRDTESYGYRIGQDGFGYYVGDECDH
jgi:hypothetical protein